MGAEPVFWSIVSSVGIAAGLRLLDIFLKTKNQKKKERLENQRLGSEVSQVEIIADDQKWSYYMRRINTLEERLAAEEAKSAKIDVRIEQLEQYLTALLASLDQEPAVVAKRVLARVRHVRPENI